MSAATDLPDDGVKKTPVQDNVLRAVFLAMLCATGYMLYLDFQRLDAEAARNGFEDIRNPYTMQPASPSDQIRPYLPSTRPVGPGRSAPDLTEFNVPEGASERDPMQFHLDDNGRMLGFGTISVGTFSAFKRALLGREKPITEFVLHSPGGSVQDALQMAETIREKNMNTRIVANGYCASSCPLVFAGGVERFAADSAWLGVHQVFTPSTTIGSIQQGMDHAQRISAQCQQALVDFGVDPALWIKAMETPKNQLYVLTVEEIEELKLATEIVEAS